MKYPDGKHVLFVVATYDPQHAIWDTRVLIESFERRGYCAVRVLR